MRAAQMVEQTKPLGAGNVRDPTLGPKDVTLTIHKK